jgi:hypothetical protein
MSDYGPFRLTIDEDLRGTATTAPEFLDAAGISLTDNSIIEMKFRAVMPALLKQLVEEFALQPAKVSKYRLAVEAVRPDLVASIEAERASIKATNA